MQISQRKNSKATSKKPRLYKLYAAFFSLCTEKNLKIFFLEIKKREKDLSPFVKISVAPRAHGAFGCHNSLFAPEFHR
jgi:hypothetical protein